MTGVSSDSGAVKSMTSTVPSRSAATKALSTVMSVVPLFFSSRMSGGDGLRLEPGLVHQCGPLRVCRLGPHGFLVKPLQLAGDRSRRAVAHSEVIDRDHRLDLGERSAQK